MSNKATSENLFPHLYNYLNHIYIYIKKKNSDLYHDKLADLYLKVNFVVHDDECLHFKILINSFP